MIRLIDCKDLFHRVQAPEPLRVIELSQGETYARLHIPGAIQLTSFEITSETGDYFPNTREEIVLYGVNPESREPKHAADFLNSLGYRHIFVLQEGKEGWMAAGYPTETSYYTKENMKSVFSLAEADSLLIAQPTPTQKAA